MNTEQFQKLVAEARERYDALPLEQKIAHDYEQRRSFMRGMCPFRRDYAEWCKVVDQALPPRG